MAGPERQSTDSGLSVTMENGKVAVTRGKLTVFVQADGTVVLSLKGCLRRVVVSTVSKKGGDTSLEFELYDGLKFISCRLVPKKSAQSPSEEAPPEEQPSPT